MFESLKVPQLKILYKYYFDGKSPAKLKKKELIEAIKNNIEIKYDDGLKLICAN